MNITYDNFENIINEGLTSQTVSVKNLDWIEPVGIALLKTMHTSQRITRLIDTESVAKRAHSYIQCLLSPSSPNAFAKTYISLQEFTRESFSQGEENIVRQVVDSILHNANNISPQDKADLRQYLIYLLGEIVRNIKDHSESDHSYIAAQFYPKHKKTQVVIIDSGIGLLQSLQSRYQDLKTHESAISLAAQPFVTRVEPNTTPYGKTTNIGLGLHMSTELIKLTNNRLKIISGDGRLEIARGLQTTNTLPFNWGGTIVTFEIFEENLNQEFGELFGYIKSTLPMEDLKIF